MMYRRIFPDPVSAPVRAEQIRLLFDQGNTILLLGIATGMVAVGMFWSVVNHTSLLVWLTALLLLTLFRLGLNHRYAATARTQPRELERWGRAYVIGTFLSGLLWGSLCLFYDPAWPAAYQVVLFAIFTGITAGAFNTNTPYFVAFPAFFMPPVLWLSFTMLQQSNESVNALGALLLIYVVLMYVSALKFHNRLAQSLAIRFENEQLAAELASSNKLLASLADTDELTGLFNRRSMFARLANEWNRMYRNHKPLSLLYLDIDCFKQYNDTYGHEAGDRCLVKVAQVLHHHALRSSDMAARFGGEEFALILPDTSNKDAHKIAASILANLEMISIPHASSSVTNFVTASIGVATLTPDMADDDAILREAADQALYQAKRQGRNRIVVMDAIPMDDSTLIQ